MRRIACFSTALLSIVFEFAPSNTALAAALVGPARLTTPLLGQVGARPAPEVESLAPASSTWLTQSGSTSSSVSSKISPTDAAYMLDENNHALGLRLNELAQSSLEAIDAMLPHHLGRNSHIPSGLHGNEGPFA